MLNKEDLLQELKDTMIGADLMLNDDPNNEDMKKIIIDFGKALSIVEKAWDDAVERKVLSDNSLIMEDVYFAKHSDTHEPPDMYQEWQIEEDKFESRVDEREYDLHLHPNQD